MVDNVYNISRLSEILGDAQNSESPSMANPSTSGLANFYPEEMQFQEEVIQPDNQESGLAEVAPTLMRPERSNLNITPEINQMAMTIDYLLGNPYGTTLKQTIDEYRNITSAQEDKNIADFEKERAYQTARADKEREYADKKAQEERKNKIESLSTLSNTVNRKEELSDAAKKRIVERAKALDPKTFGELDDNATIELLKGYTKPTTGLSIEDRLLLEETKQKGKKDLAEQKFNYDKELTALRLSNSKQNLKNIESDIKANADADVISSLNEEIESWYPEGITGRAWDSFIKKAGISTAYTRNINKVKEILQTKIAKINGDSRFTENEAKRIIDTFGLSISDDLDMAKSKLSNLERYLRPGVTKEQTRQMLIQDGLADSKSTPAKKKEQPVKNNKLTDADLDKLWSE